MFPYPARRSPRQPPKFFRRLPERKSSNPFNYFSPLPLELRLKIWRSAFPDSRDVRIDLFVLRAPRAKLPVTLFVNHESRTETLRHYTIVFPTDIFEYETTLVTPPFCLNASMDSVFILTNGTLLSKREEFLTWLDYLDLRLPGGLNSIRALKLIGYVDVLPGPGAHEITVWQNLPLATWLLRFGGLKNLCVDVTSSNVQKKGLEQKFVAYLDTVGDKFVSKVPPKLIVEGVD